MAGFIRNLIDSMKLTDDDEGYEAYEQETEQRDRARRTAEKPSYSASSDKIKLNDRSTSSTSFKEQESEDDKLHVKKVHNTSNYGSSTYIESRNNNKTLRMERPGESKVVPIKTIRTGLELCVMKPHNFEESQDICDVLLSSCCAIVNLEDNELAVSRRIMDFIYGVVYSINGKLIQISDYIFIVAPDNIDVSGDYEDILAQAGYDIPSLQS